jgi:hypothetical protein
MDSDDSRWVAGRGRDHERWNWKQERADSKDRVIEKRRERSVVAVPSGPAYYPRWHCGLSRAEKVQVQKLQMVRVIIPKR